MTLKTLVTGVAAAAMVGAAAAGVTSIASGPLTAMPAVQPVVFDIPLPLQPAADVPSTDQLMAVLNGLANPNVPFRSKDGLVEGGVGIVEGKAADKVMAGAAQDGTLPNSFVIDGIAPARPGLATATVTASGPALAPTTQTVTFVNQGGWRLSRASATSLLQAALA